MPRGNGILPACLSVVAIVACGLGGRANAGASAATLSLTVQLVYPAAQLHGSDLFLRGDGCGLSWDAGVRATPAGADTFLVALRCPAGTDAVQVKALVDDSAWQRGANSVLHVPSLVAASPSTTNATATLYPWFFRTNGRLAFVRSVASQALGNARDVAVYLPPVHDENPLAVLADVAVFHDGNNLFDGVQCDGCCPYGCWGLQQVLDSGIEAGQLRGGLAVVGVYNTPSRIAEYTYSHDASESEGGKADAYLDFLEAVVYPRVRATFPRLQWRAGSLVMAGSSLGGLLSCYAGWTRAATYRGAACMSSSFWWNDEDFLHAVMPASPPPRATDFYLDSGDSGPSDDDVAQTQRVRDAMAAANVSMAYFLDHGATHSEAYWGRRVWRPLAQFFGTGVDVSARAVAAAASAETQ